MRRGSALPMIRRCMKHQPKLSPDGNLSQHWYEAAVTTPLEARDRTLALWTAEIERGGERIRVLPLITIKEM